MEECITLTVPARESALMIVRLTAAGVAARGGTDLETLDDLKTAVYEACYAMTMQRFVPQNLSLRFAAEGPFSVWIEGRGAWRETGGREPDVKLCNAVLCTMVPHVSVEMESGRILRIHMHQ